MKKNNCPVCKEKSDGKLTWLTPEVRLDKVCKVCFKLLCDESFDEVRKRMKK